MKRGLALLGAGGAAAVAMLAGGAAASVPPALKLPVPPPGAISLAVFTVSGRLRPGATLPTRTNFADLVSITGGAPIPPSLAIYGAERTVETGTKVTLTLGLVALRPAAGKAPSAATDFPSVSAQAKDDVALALELFVRGAVFDLNREFAARDEFKLTPGPSGATMFAESEPLFKDYIADYGSADAAPVDVFESAPELKSDVNWADGHNFGWKLKGSPSGSGSVTPVLHDLDAVIREIIGEIDDSAADTVDSKVVSSMEKLDAAVGFPAGSLTGASTGSSGSTATTPATGSSRGATLTVVDNVAGFGGAVCSPGGGMLELSWKVEGAKPGATIVVSLTGPEVPPQVKATVAADGSASVDVPVSGTGTWTDTIVSVGGMKATGATVDHAQETCLVTSG